VLKEGANVSADDLIKHCKDKLAGYKCPKTFVFRYELPETAVGKIPRNEVKKHFWRTTGKQIA
jgi:fatty-acyl-CoA synthase